MNKDIREMLEFDLETMRGLQMKNRRVIEWKRGQYEAALKSKDTISRKITEIENKLTRIENETD